MSSGPWEERQVRSWSGTSWGCPAGALGRAQADRLSCGSGRSQTARGGTPPDRATRDPGACRMLRAVSR